MIKILRAVLLGTSVLVSALGYGQKPVIHYPTPKTYTAGVAITIPLQPSNTGGQVPPSTPITLGSGFSNITSLALDAAGDVYLVSNGSNAIYMISPIDGSTVSIGSGYNSPTGVAVDASGNVYVADFGNNLVKKIPAGGGAIVSLGTGLSSPYGICANTSGDIFVSDRGSNTIKKITQAGVTTTYATGFNTPTGLAIDAAGNIYVTDRGNNLIKKIAVGGAVTTVGPGSGNPNGVGVDGAGNVYYADTGLSSIMELPAAGGAAISIGSGFNTPAGVTVNSGGDVFVADNGNQSVKAVKIGGYSISPALPAGINFSTETGIIDGTPTAASPATNYTVTAFNSSGSSTAIVNISVNGVPAPHISYATPQTLTASSAVTLVPENQGGAVSSGGYAVHPDLPRGLALNADNGVISGIPFFSQSAADYTVTATNPTGSGSFVLSLAINTPAKPNVIYPSPLTFGVNNSVNTVSPSNSGGAVPSRFKVPFSTQVTTTGGLCVDSHGNLYAFDMSQHILKKIPAGGGTPINITSDFQTITAIAVDASDNIFINDYPNNAIRKIPAGGGTPVIVGTDPDKPFQIALDQAGNIYITDNTNQIKKIPAGGGPATALTVNNLAIPNYIAVDAAGNLYITDLGDHSVKKILPGNATPVVLSSNFNTPNGIALDASGNIYIADDINFMIKRIPATGGSAVNTFNVGETIRDIALDKIGNVYVTNSYSSHVELINAGGYFVSPDLPDGIVMESYSGRISGTPTATHPATNYTVTSYNAAGISTTVLNITIDNSTNPVPVITYNSPQVYTINKSIQPLVPASSSVSNYSGLQTVTSIPNSLASTRGIAVDAAGNIFVTQLSSNTVQKFPVAGGSPVIVASGFSTITGMVTDASGNIYVVDNGNHAVKKIPAGGGSVTTLASGLNSPYGLAIDYSGNLYVSNVGDGTVQKIPAGGGAPVQIATGLSSPRPVTVDATGNVYVADDAGNIWVIYAGSATTAFRFGFGSQINGMAMDAGGNLFFTSPVDPSYPFELPAGSNNYTIVQNTQLSTPVAITVDAKHAIYINDFGHSAIVKMTPRGGYYISPALPQGVAFDKSTGIISGTPTDGCPAKDYTVTAYNSVGSGSANINIKVNYNPSLFGLSLSSGALNPGFSATTTSYTANVTNATAAITVTPSVGTIYQVKVNAVTVNPGESSQSIPLAVGVNNITIVVSAPDGSITKTYTVAVTRASASASTNAALASILLNPNTPLTATQQSGYVIYNGTVPNSETSVKVIPTAQDAHTTITVNDVAVASGGSSASIPLGVGDNFIYIISTAGDGATTAWYEIIINRAAASLSTNAVLSVIALTPKAALTATTGPGYKNYTVSVPNSQGTLVVTPTAQDTHATITVNGTAIASGTASQSIPLAVGNNVITLLCTAQDGATTKTYIITASRAGSSIATLSNLALSTGTLSPAFAASIISYTAIVPYATSSVQLTPTVTDAAATVKVNGTVVTSGTASAAIPLVVGSNTITTVVTAQDGTTAKTYTTTITRTASSLSTNALLTTIALTPKTTLTPTTGPGYKNYTATVANTVSSIQVTPTAQDANAIIKVNGQTVASGTLSQAIPLAVGANTITIAVTAQDGATTKIYIITATRAGSSIATLSNLAISAGMLNPVFAAATISYTAIVPYATASIKITPAVTDAAATVKVNGAAITSGTASAAIPLAVGSNTITTIVTAQDGTTTKTYTTKITRAASNLPTNAVLSVIGLTPKMTLTATTGPGYKNYTATVANTVSSIQVTPTAQDANATIKVNGIAVASGTASQPVPLTVGDNTVNIIVTAQDGATVKDYMITVTRAASAIATLSNLAISAGTLSPVFAANTISYTAILPYATASVKITPTATNANATIKVNGAAVPSGTASGIITLAVGSNTITTIVTAQDGTTTKTYTTTVTRATASASTNAALSVIALSPKTMLTNTGTVNGVTTYTTAVAFAESTLKVTPTAQNANATIKVNGTTVASGTASPSIALAVGNNSITLVCTAQDGATIRTYVITATRAASGLVMKYDGPADAPIQAAGVTVHRGLSPNGDGDNDVLTIDGITNYPDNNLQIMSRSGELVYQVKGYNNQNKAFDGHSSTSGKQQPAGTYFYSLDYKDGGETKHKTGFIVLKY